jgi:hypothetical protein
MIALKQLASNAVGLSFFFFFFIVAVLAASVAILSKVQPCS